MQKVECAIFHLNTIDITASDTVGDYPIYKAEGTINTQRNDFTWNNVDFKTILGDMFDKYDKFNIKLSSVMYSAQNPFGTAPDDRCVKINMVGLPFSNASYHQKASSTSQYTTIGSFNLTQSQANQLYFNDDNVFTIYKPASYSNVRIYLNTQYDVFPTSVAGTLYPHFDFYFRIYGVK